MSKPYDLMCCRLTDRLQNTLSVCKATLVQRMTERGPFVVRALVRLGQLVEGRVNVVAEIIAGGRIRDG